MVSKSQLSKRIWRTEIPNLALTLRLNPYELALYVIIKRTAGDRGVCWKSTRTLAAESGMSEGMVSKCKRSLAEPRQELGGKSLIRVEEYEKNGSASHRITAVNFWDENTSYHLSATSKGVHGMNGVVHSMQTPVHPVKQRKNLTKNEPKEESPIAPCAVAPPALAVEPNDGLEYLPRAEVVTRFSCLFQRESGSEWTAKELRALHRLLPIKAEDVEVVEAYYAAERLKPRARHRRSLQAFLDEFRGEVDRARDWKLREPPKKVWGDGRKYVF